MELEEEQMVNEVREERGLAEGSSPAETNLNSFYPTDADVAAVFTFS